MTDKEERASIVAWLRENVAECERLEMLFRSQQAFSDSYKIKEVGQSQEGIAQAIERGDHHKGKDHE